MRIASLHYDWRRANGFADTIAAGCNSCRVSMDREVCKLASADCTSCPIARGRFRATLRSALKVIGPDKFHLTPAAERFAQQEGLLANLQLERVAIIKSIGSTESIDNEIREASKLSGKYGREAGILACVRGQREPEYDTEVFAGAS